MTLTGGAIFCQTVETCTHLRYDNYALVWVMYSSNFHHRIQQNHQTSLVKAGVMNNYEHYFITTAYVIRTLKINLGMYVKWKMLKP